MSKKNIARVKNREKNRQKQKEKKEEKNHMEHATEIPEGENWIGDIYEKLLSKVLKKLIE